MKGSIAKTATILIILTLVSRVFGFAREIVVAGFFGATKFTDAFLVAAAVPSMLYGALGAAVDNVFIPVYDRYKGKGRDKALVYKFTLFTLVLVSGFFVVPIFLRPESTIWLFVPGWSEGMRIIAAEMLQILIFAVVIRLLVVIVQAVLHVNGNFYIPGLTGLPFSLSIMACTVLLYPHLGIYGLVWGTVLGYGAQLLLMAPWYARVKFTGRISAGCNDGLRQIALLMPPVLLSTILGEMKAMVDRFFASTLEPGSISYLDYAQKITDLPNGLLVVTVVTVVYHSFVSHANSGKKGEIKRVLSEALSSLLFVVVPISVGLFIMAEPIVGLIYQRGSFGPTETKQTAVALRMFAIGLSGITVWLLMMKTLYSLRDTFTPLVIMVISISANTLLNFVLVGTLGHEGLALATSISYSIGAVLLTMMVVKRIGAIGDGKLMVEFGKVLVASLAMGAVVYLGWGYISLNLLANRIQQATITLALIIIASCFYFLLAWVMGIGPIKRIWNLLVSGGRSFFSKN